MSVGHDNLRITNCELGYISGCEVETGIEVFGASDGTYIGNSYLHDIGGALTCQNSQVTNTTSHIQNVEYDSCVVTTSVTGAENWNTLGNIGDDGIAQNHMINQYIHDNIFAYMGYSKTKLMPPAAFASAVNSSMYSEMENCVFENNTIMYGSGWMFYAYLATDTQERGWICRNNTYIGNPEHMKMQYSYETTDRINHKMGKGNRIDTPYNYRYLVYYTSHGVDPAGSYYYYGSDMDRRIINDRFDVK